jgi:hypothetical protein
MAKWNREVALDDDEAGEMPFALTSEGGEDARVTGRGYTDHRRCGLPSDKVSKSLLSVCLYASWRAV